MATERKTYKDNPNLKNLNVHTCNREELTEYTKRLEEEVYNLHGMERPRNTPPKYTPLQLQQGIDAYFKSITRYVAETDDWGNVKKDENGKPIMSNVKRYIDNPSILKMCLYLKLSKQTLNKYAKKSEYKYIIEMAYLEIEAYLEQRLEKVKAPGGIIFNLKNSFGWVDKREVTSTVNKVDANTSEQVNKQLEEKLTKLKVVK